MKDKFTQLDQVEINTAINRLLLSLLTGVVIFNTLLNLIILTQIF